MLKLSPVSFFLWLASAVFAALLAVVFVEPLQNFFRSSIFVQQRSALIWGALSDGWAYVPLAAVFLGGVVTASWLFKGLGWLQDSKKGYVDTRLRLKYVPGQEDAFVQDFQSNIYNWRQSRFILGFKDVNGNAVGQPVVYTVLTILFDREIEHERMMVATYGHPTPAFHVTPLGRGCLIQFEESLQTPVIEFFFPPVGYHAHQQKAQYEPVAIHKGS